MNCERSSGKGALRRSRHDRIEKIAEILTAAKQCALKHHIIQKSHLSNESFDQYIHQLLQYGLLNAYPAIDLHYVAGPKTRHRMIYQTSRKGRQFLMIYDPLMQLLTVEAKHNDQRQELQV